MHYLPTITLSPTATYDVSKLYPTQDSNFDTQKQLEAIQESISKVNEYLKTSKPDVSQLQDAFKALENAVISAQQQAQIEKLEQSRNDTILFILGLLIGGLFGWINFEPPLVQIDQKAPYIHFPIFKKENSLPKNEKSGEGSATQSLPKETKPKKARSSKKHAGYR